MHSGTFDKRKIMTRIFIHLCGAMLISGLALAQTGDEILKKVDRNLMPESFESYRKLINIEPDGSKREFILFSLKKGNDKVVSLFNRLRISKLMLFVTELGPRHNYREM